MIEVKNEDDARLLLASGNPEQINQGIALVHDLFAVRAYKAISARSVQASREDQEEIWQDVLLDISEIAHAERIDLDQSLSGLVMTILQRRAIDWFRKRKNLPRVDGSNVLDAVGMELKMTLVGTKWSLAGADRRNDILGSIREFTQQLPPKQQMVLQVFIDGFPETRNMETLRLAVAEATGEPVTLASVKRAMQEVRRKANDLIQDIQ